MSSTLATWLGAVSIALFIGSFAYRLLFGSWRQEKDPDAAALAKVPLNDNDQELLDKREPDPSPSPPLPPQTQLPQTQLPMNSVAMATLVDVAQNHDVPPMPIKTATAAAQTAAPPSHDLQLEAIEKTAIEKTMPTELAANAHSPEHAIPLVLALLFDDKPEVRSKQEACVRQFLGEPALTDANALAPQVAQLDPMLRLPTAEFAFPTLRKRPRPELTSLIACVDAMAQADGETSLFEYCIGCMLHRQLTQSLDPSANWRAGRKKLLDVLDEIALLLSLIAQNGIAQNGGDSATAAETAYTAGMHSILPDASIAYAPPAEGVAALDKVWSALDGLDGIGKTLLIEGAVATIGSVGKMTVAQSELLRTACAVLDSPLPPMLGHA